MAQEASVRDAMDTAVDLLLVDPKPTDSQRALLKTVCDALVNRPDGVVMMGARRSDGLTLLVAAEVAAAMHVMIARNLAFHVDLEPLPMCKLFVQYVHQFLVVLRRGEYHLTLGEDGASATYSRGQDWAIITSGKFRPKNASVVITSGARAQAAEGCTTLGLVWGQ
jgi:hypothetical protein